MSTSVGTGRTAGAHRTAEGVDVCAGLSEGGRDAAALPSLDEGGGLVRAVCCRNFEAALSKSRSSITPPLSDLQPAVISLRLVLYLNALLQFRKNQYLQKDFLSYKEKNKVRNYEARESGRLTGNSEMSHFAVHKTLRVDRNSRTK